MNTTWEENVPKPRNVFVFCVFIIRVAFVGRCYHFGVMSFSGYDTLAGGRTTVGVFG